MLEAFVIAVAVLAAAWFDHRRNEKERKEIQQRIDRERPNLDGQTGRM